MIARTPAARTECMPLPPDNELAPLSRVEALEKAIEGVSNVELAP